MYLYIAHRLIQLVPVTLVVTMVTFSLLLLIPGDPAMQMLGERATPEALAKLRHDLALDQPIPVQYVLWLGRAVQGDFGRSLQSRQPVSRLLAERLPVTLQIGLISFVLAAVVGVPAGIFSAIRRNSGLDTSITVLSTVGFAMPPFWLGILLIYLLALVLHLLPTSGYVPFFKDPLQSLRLSIMPSLCLSMAMIAVITRQTRSAMLEVLGQDYIRTAAAKGLRERLVITRHALKNALIPVVTVAGVMVGRIFGGAVLVETIFALPGVGRLMVDSIFLRDFPVVQAVVLVMAAAVLLSNLTVDLLYGFLDPRIRFK